MVVWRFVEFPLLACSDPEIRLNLLLGKPRGTTLSPRQLPRLHRILAQAGCRGGGGYISAGRKGIQLVGLCGFWVFVGSQHKETHGSLHYAP